MKPYLSALTFFAAALLADASQAITTAPSTPSTPGGDSTLVGLVTYPERNIHTVVANGPVNGINGESVQDRTPFRIASVTKTFTAATIFKLAEQGRFGLDTAIKNLLLPETAAQLSVAGVDSAKITVRQLLGHRSGLLDYANAGDYTTTILSNPGKKWTRAEQLSIALKAGDAQSPDAAYRYADTNYILLGEIIEQATGQKLANSYRNLLNFQALGLTQTYLESAEPAPAGSSQRLHSFVQGFDTYGIDASFDLYGGGGLVSTTKDLTTFFRALFAGRVVNANSLKLMTQSVSGGGFAETAYTLGLMPFYLGNHLCYGHEGFASVVVGHCPSIDYTFVYAAGSDQASGILLPPNQSLAYDAAAAIGIDVLPKPYRKDFERTSCSPELLSDNAKTTCGMLSVAENRNNPNSRKIRFPVLIAKHTSKPAQIEPLLVLGGGPGDALFPGLPALFTDPDASTALLDGQDIVAVEYRGVGAATPRLQCDNRLNSAATVAKCREKFNALGVDLKYYNSHEISADLEQLRRSLNVPRWNVLGLSYGTRAALTLLRERPNTIKSLVLDGATPPEEGLNNADDYAKTINAVFASCKASVSCNAAFPNLKARLFKTLKQLNKSPLVIQGLAISGDNLVQTFVALQGNPDVLTYLPEVMDAFAKADSTLIGKILAGDTGGSSDNLLPPDPTFSDGMFFSTICNEQAPFVNRKRLAMRLKGNNPIRRSVAQNVQTNLAICKQWPSGRANARVIQPVPLSVPTLVFNGEFDLQTPASIGRALAARNPLAKGLDFPAIGHIAVQQSPACAIAILADFQRTQDAHAVDASCIATLPKANWKTAVDTGFFDLINSSQ